MLVADSFALEIGFIVVQAYTAGLWCNWDM